MPSAKVVTVLEDGRRSIYRMKVARDLPGRFVISKEWLVYETYPREVEGERRRRATEAAIALGEARALAKARSNPAFKAFTRRLRKELGPPRAASACDREHLAYSAPSDTRCAELIQEARRSGASATLYLAPWGRELRVVPGGVGALVALFDWNTYGPRALDRAFEALDAEAGLTLDYVWTWEDFAFHLDRAPRRPATHARVIAEHLCFKRAFVLARLKERAWLEGRDTCEWQKLSVMIRDPGTEDDEEDDK